MTLNSSTHRIIVKYMHPYIDGYRKNILKHIKVNWKSKEMFLYRFCTAELLCEYCILGSAKQTLLLNNKEIYKV